MNITYYKQAVKALERIDTTRQRIGRAILSIPKGDIKKWQGHTELFWLRVGDWRIVSSYPDSETVLIEKNSPREDVYKGV